MQSNAALLIAGAVGLAAVVGVTYAATTRQADRPAALPEVSISSPSPVPPSASPLSTANPPVATPAPTELPPSQPIAPAATAQNVAASRRVETCTVTNATVDDPNPPLNVRSAPSTNNKVIGTLKNGETVLVEAEQSGWFRISVPMQGWISKKNVRSTCNVKVERVSFGTGKTSTTVSDRFIGTGSHRYVFNAGKGQVMTVSRNDGPFPTLRSPNGKVLAESMQDEKRPQWSGALPQTGDYVVELESNFKGYPYSFKVEIK